jgi:hypothetical protein
MMTKKAKRSYAAMELHDLYLMRMWVRSFLLPRRKWAHSYRIRHKMLAGA